MNKIITKIRQELKRASDPHTKTTGQNFFKEKIKLYGVKTAVVSKIAKENYEEVKGLNKNQIFEICEEFWKSGYMEESFIACDWSYRTRKDFKKSDFKVFEKWVENYVANWASCDTLCNHTVAALIEIYPELITDLKKWAKSKNLWMRRAAAVTLIIPARHGKFLPDIFEIANILLQDKEDLVQKGYGWMLKAASESNQKKVFEYVIKNKTKMPRTALRYAIEKMPENLRKKAMEKETITK